MSAESNDRKIAKHFLEEEIKVKVYELANYYDKDRLTVEINLDKSLNSVKIKITEHE